MRRLIAFTSIVILFASCNQNAAPASDKKDAMAPASDTVKYPYKPLYSSSFSIGDAANSKIILDLWKAYEDNRLMDTKSYWGDSVTMEFADGFKVHTGRDSLLAMAVAHRGMYTSVVDSVQAWIPLHSTDRNENWVGIWAMEYTVDAKGKKDTADLHEIWQIKDGKIVYMAQYSAKRKM